MVHSRHLRREGLRGKLSYYQVILLQSVCVCISVSCVPGGRVYVCDGTIGSYYQAILLQCVCVCISVSCVPSGRVSGWHMLRRAFNESHPAFVELSTKAILLS